jgi:hypothetical protein
MGGEKNHVMKLRRSGSEATPELLVNLVQFQSARNAALRQAHHGQHLRDRFRSILGESRHGKHGVQQHRPQRRRRGAQAVRKIRVGVVMRLAQRREGPDARQLCNG